MITGPAMQDDDDVSGRSDFLVEMKKRLKSVGSSDAGNSPRDSRPSPRNAKPSHTASPRESPRVATRDARVTSQMTSPPASSRNETCTRQEKSYREESVEIFPFASPQAPVAAEVTSPDRTSSVTSPRAFDAKSLIEEERKKFQEYKK